MGIAKFYQLKIQQTLYYLSVGFTVSEVNSKLQWNRKCVPNRLGDLFNLIF